MEKDIKAFYDKLEKLEIELEQQRSFLNKHNFNIESMSLNEKLEMLRRIKISYSLFFDGTLTIDQINLNH